MGAPRLHHIGVVVKELTQALGTYEILFGASRVGPTVDDPVQQAHICFMHVPGTEVLVELVAPYDAKAPVANFLDRRGGGLHHVCYVVRDIRETIGTWRTSGGIPVFGPVQAVAFGGCSIAFMYLRDRSLVELVEGNPDGRPIELLAEGRG